MWQRFWTMGSLDFCCSHLKKIHTIEIEKKQLWTLALSNFWAWKFKFQNPIFHAKKSAKMLFHFFIFLARKFKLIFSLIEFFRQKLNHLPGVLARRIKSQKSNVIFLWFWRENSNLQVTLTSLTKTVSLHNLLFVQKIAILENSLGFRDKRKNEG